VYALTGGTRERRQLPITVKTTGLASNEDFFVAQGDDHLSISAFIFTFDYKALKQEALIRSREVGESHGQDESECPKRLFGWSWKGMPWRPKEFMIRFLGATPFSTFMASMFFMYSFSTTPREEGQLHG
jgi:hypothetical protein